MYYLGEIRWYFSAVLIQTNENDDFAHVEKEM
jgi:hypothetical protein